ncbi:MAG TPA: alkaline phosphatase family protein [Pseudolysinimonas sp.]|nr:alkaline phosphatase family protein [Pseudolysinimonas sp.]
MLPAAKTSRFSLADVLPNCLDALAGRTGRLGLSPVTHAVVVLADGLGRAVLEAHRGHARTLASRLDVDPAISAGFPTTTASALATLTTGTLAGQHGMVGYRVLDPASGTVINQLSGLDTLDPSHWQRMPTLFETSAASGVRSVVIASPRHRDSGFTHAVLRGAAYRAEATLADRFAAARRELAAAGPTLVYLYVAELDVEAHARGLDSARWVAALESLDAEVGALAADLTPRQGMLLTADHGMVDVPESSQIIVPPELLAGVRQIAGEPRCLQLHLEPGIDPDAVAGLWRNSQGSRAWVATRDEAIAAGWFGDVDDAVRPRIGDVLVAARKRYAFYADPDDTGRRMIGQHGSLTPDETSIPLLRFGAFA